MSQPMTRLEPGDLACASTNREERGLVTCEECGDLFESRGGAYICRPCDYRISPRCACGKCHELARMAADIYVDGLHVQREVYFDEAHASGTCDPKHNVDVEECGNFADILKARPCWCKLGDRGVVGWCPEHGVRE